MATGRSTYLVKEPDFNTDPYPATSGYWKKSEDTYKLEGLPARTGRSLWRYDMAGAIEEGIW